MRGYGGISGEAVIENPEKDAASFVVEREREATKEESFMQSEPSGSLVIL